MNVSNGCSNVVLNTSICYDECSWWVIQWFNGDFVKFLDVRYDVMTNLLTKKMEREAISISVYDSMTREQFWVNRIKERKNLIEVIFHVY